jgi:hypothetical protein
VGGSKPTKNGLVLSRSHHGAGCYNITVASVRCPLSPLESDPCLACITGGPAGKS